MSCNENNLKTLFITCPIHQSRLILFIPSIHPYILDVQLEGVNFKVNFWGKKKNPPKRVILKCWMRNLKVLPIWIFFRTNFHYIFKYLYMISKHPQGAAFLKLWICFIVKVTRAITLCITRDIIRNTNLAAHCKCYRWTLRRGCEVTDNI